MILLVILMSALSYLSARYKGWVSRRNRLKLDSRPAFRAVTNPDSVKGRKIGVIWRMVNSTDRTSIAVHIGQPITYVHAQVTCMSYVSHSLMWKVLAHSMVSNFTLE